MTRVAVWGLGGHARRNLLPALVSSANVSLRGVWTRSAQARADVAAEYDVVAYASADAMLADSEVDAVVVATPVGLHVAHGVQVLRAGKDLWCEKSLAANLGQAQDLIRAADETGQQVHELFMFLWHPQFAALQELVSSGQLGEVRGVTARFGFPHLASDNVRYSKELGGGALRDAGAYPYAAAHALLGVPTSHAQQLWTAPGYDVDTEGSALLTYDCGARALLEWGFGLSYRNEIEVWGTEGSARLQRAFSKPGTLETQISVQPQSGAAHVVTVAPANHFERMFSNLDGRTGKAWCAAQAQLLFRSTVD